jgi:hypothetical protein
MAGNATVSLLDVALPAFEVVAYWPPIIVSGLAFIAIGLAIIGAGIIIKIRKRKIEKLA